MFRFGKARPRHGSLLTRWPDPGDCGRSLLTVAARGDVAAWPGVPRARLLRSAATSTSRKRAGSKSFSQRSLWVDTPGSELTSCANSAQRGPAFQQLFWNRSVNRVVLMPGATIIDPFPADAVTIARDGSLRAGDDPLDGPLLVDQHVVTVQLSGAKEVATAPGYSLFEPTGTPRCRCSRRRHTRLLGGRRDLALALWAAPWRDLLLDLVARGLRERADRFPFRRPNVECVFRPTPRWLRCRFCSRVAGTALLRAGHC